MSSVTNMVRAQHDFRRTEQTRGNAHITPNKYNSTKTRAGIASQDGRGATANSGTGRREPLPPPPIQLTRQLE